MRTYRPAVVMLLSVVALALTGCDKKTKTTPKKTTVANKKVKKAQPKKEEAKKEEAKKEEAKKEEPKKEEPKKEEPKKEEAKKEEPKKEEAKKEEPGEWGVETLKDKIKRYEPVEIAFDEKLLDDKQKQALVLLIKAANVMDELFWQQASAEGLELRKKWEASEDEAEKLLLHFLKINYGPFDRLSEHEAFPGTAGKPKGGTYYPADMKKEELVKWLEEHPDDKKAFQSNFTAIRRQDDKLVAVPYSQEYGERLKEAAELLKKAAELVGNESLAKYLESRAEAFLSDDYFQSDMDWMDVAGSVLDVTIGPYEVYEDALFNYKAAFEAFICIVDPEESKRLDKLKGLLPDMEKNLPIPDEHKNLKRGSESPIRVVDLAYSAGDTRAGVQTLAFNLPNDERVREAKGSKKVMLRNVVQAKFDKVMKPIAAQVLVEDQVAKVGFDPYFMHTVVHELSHGLGPGTIEKDGKKTTVNLALKELYSTVEEAKADTLGHFNYAYAVEKGVFPTDSVEPAHVTYLAGFFRSIRFGAEEAHGKANIIQINYLLEKGAFTYDDKTHRFGVNFDKIDAGVKDLVHDLLMLEALGDYENAKAFVEKYGKVPDSVKAALAKLGGIPVDIYPTYTTAEALLKAQ